MYQGSKEWSERKGLESYYLGTCENPEELENEAEKLVLKNLKKSKVKIRIKLILKI